jgi:hypothetical protein
MLKQALLRTWAALAVALCACGQSGSPTASEQRLGELGGGIGGGVLEGDQPGTRRDRDDVPR